MIPFIKHLWNNTILELENRSVISKGWGWEEGVVAVDGYKLRMI